MTTYTVEINEVNTDKLWLVANMAMDPILGALRIAPGVDGYVSRCVCNTLILIDLTAADTLDYRSKTNTSYT